MTTNAGLWLDHREAVIVLLTRMGEETLHVQSNVEKHGHGSSEIQHPTADDSREREYTGHLARYYDEIISHLHDADSLLIFGPGEAKGELRKRLDNHPTETQSVTVETADKMTQPQIVALVRHHFHRDAARQ